MHRTWKNLRRISRRLAGLVFLSVFALPTVAQYRFDQWTADNGLPQNSVNAIVQTRDGYLWLATVDGLVRFDGVRFTVFKKSNSPGIINNRFRLLFEAANGDLWAATEESGFVRYRNGQFFSYGVESGLDSLTMTNPFYQPHIWEDGNGNPIFQLQNNEYYIFSGEMFLRINAGTDPAPSGANFSPESDSANTLPGSASTNCGYDSGRSFLCLVNGQWQSFPYPESLPKPLFRFAAYDVDGTMWILTTEGKVVRADKNKTSEFYGKLRGEALMLVPGTNIHSLSKDNEGAIWLTNLHTGSEELLTRSAPAAFSPYEILNGYRDREGNFWFGTRRGGLFRVRKQLITTYSKADGLADNNVYPVFEDRQGTIWVGTTRGLFKYQNDTFTQIKATGGKEISGLGEDDSGSLLVNYTFNSLRGTSVGSLFRLENEELKLVYQSPDGANWAIHTDSEKAVWIGNQNGLIRYKDNLATTFTTNEGLAGNNVKVIIDDKNGGLWIGSYGGLSHYKDGKLNKWTETDGLTIRSLYQEGNGVLWIGTYDSGLARFKDGKFTFYTSKNGLYNDGAFQILEDGQKNFWINSNRGIYRVRKDELNEFAEGKRRSISSVGYGKSDGLLNVEGNGGRSPGGIKSRDGRLWFPTQDGVAVINPAAVTVNQKPPPVIVENVKINDQSIPMETLSDSLGNPQTAIRIEPNQQNFEIQYTALSFVNSENLRFKYKLEGLDNDWIDAANRRTAYFSYVPPGEYTFRVIAANSDGVWNEEGKSLKIVVLPPFYRTWWFFILSVLSFCGLIFYIYRRRVSQLEREKKSQEILSRRLIELQENERKRLAGELHDSLSQNLVIIKNRAMMSLSEPDNASHAFEQMEEIAEAAVESLAEVREIAANLRPFQIDRLGLTKALQSLVRKPTFNNLGIRSQIDDIDNLLLPELEINLYRILQESLSNIIKHSAATEAKVKIERTGKSISVEISDNGKGFDWSDGRGENKSVGGFGLTGMSERARILGSSLSIESTPGSGTTIRFQINY